LENNKTINDVNNYMYRRRQMRRPVTTLVASGITSWR